MTDDTCLVTRLAVATRLSPGRERVRFPYEAQSELTNVSADS
jgi:hypothetical protein